jgi:hypothetical protein
MMRNGTLSCVFVQVWQMLENQAKRIKEEGSSLKVSVDARAFFVTASAGYSQSEDNSESQQDMSKSTTRSKTVIGASIDPVTGTIPPTLQPGLLSGETASFCHMLSMIPGVKDDTMKACHNFAKSQRFCYSNLPKTVDPTNNFQTLKEHVFASRSFEHCLTDFGVPLFGLKLGGESFTGFQEFPHKSLDECMMDCSKQNCSLAIVRNGVCQMCTPQPRERYVLFDDGKYGVEDCSYVLRTEANTNVGFVEKGGAKRCIADRGADFDDSNCFKHLTSCEENEDCFGIVRQLPKSHINEDVGQAIGLRLSDSDFVFGENKGVSTVQLSVKQPEKCLFMRDIMQRFIPGSVPKRDIRGRMMAERHFGKWLRKAADVCSSRCLKIPGCDSMEVRWPDMEGDLRALLQHFVQQSKYWARNSHNRSPYVLNDPTREVIDVTDTDRPRLRDPRAIIAKIKHEPLFENETFGMNAPIDIMDINPKVILSTFAELEDSQLWGRLNYDFCKDRFRDLLLNLKCSYFSKSEVFIQHAKTKWCQKSEKFCDFKTGIFAEMKSYRSNIFHNMGPSAMDRASPMDRAPRHLSPKNAKRLAGIMKRISSLTDSK